MGIEVKRFSPEFSADFFALHSAPRDRLPNLVRKFGLVPDPGALAISYFYVARGSRRRGIAAHLLRGVLSDLKAQGVGRVEASPRRGPALREGDMWNGPAPMLVEAGFRVRREDASRPILEIALKAEAPAAKAEGRGANRRPFRSVRARRA